MSVLSTLRFALCCSLSLSIPVAVSATTEAESVQSFGITTQSSSSQRALTPAPTSGALPSDPSRPITVAFLMPEDNSPVIAANKIVLNGLTAAAMFKPNIRLLLIETGRAHTLAQQLQAAVFAGADVVVGPLQRDRVDELLQLPYLPLPVLTLNTPSQSPTETPAHLLSMSLSTEMEASYVGNLVANEFYELHYPDARVLILRDAGKTDYRITEGFEAALQARHVPYQIEPVDLSSINSIKRFFNTANAEKQFPLALVAMGSTDASLVLNRLPRGTQAWGISVLNPGDPDTNPTASSLVYDLNNAIFVDSPLVVKYDKDSFEAKFATPQPYSLTAKRLFALGFDALLSAEHWAHQDNQFSFSGEAGDWTLNRELSYIVERKPLSILIQDGSLQPLTLESGVKKAN